MIVRPYSIALDSEALSALSLRDPQIRLWAEMARRTDSVLYASAATLAEVADGTPRDARIRIAVKAVRVVPVTTEIGFRAGSLRSTAAPSRRKRRDLTVDALVAATALSLPAPVIVLMSDPNDVRLLLSGTSVRVEQLG